MFMTATAFVAAARQYNQVGDDDPPPDPPLEALQSMIGTARQLYRAAHHTNAPFNAIAKPLAVLEPRLLFIGSALRRFGAGLGQRNLFNPQALRQPFIGGREQPLIPGQQPRGMLEAVAMAVQDRGQQLVIGGIAGGDDLPVAKEASVHFSIVDLMPKLGLPWAGFPAPNNLRMRFTQTDHFLVR